MHEIGHSFKIGRGDDATNSLDPSDIQRNFEVYSGGEGDDTVEPLSPGGPGEWSLMAGTTTELARSPMEGQYFVFSIEELSTINEP